MVFDNKAHKRVQEIWNHRNLKTMSEADHKALSLELWTIQKVCGVGGMEAFEELCSKIRENRGANPHGVYLKGLRYREEMTQVQLAEITGIPRRHISEMESGKRIIDKAAARKFANALKAADYRLFLVTNNIN